MPEKKTISLSNGETYAYVEQKPENAPTGETILLLHGNSASSLIFLPLFRRLTNIHLIAPDMRGFGDSSYNQGFSSLIELADDIKEFVNALGISKAHVAGLSAGGGVAFELAVKYPEFVSSLFIIQGLSHRGIPFFSKKPDGTFAPFANREELAADPILMAPALALLEQKNSAFIDLFWKKTIYVNKQPPAEDNEIYIAENIKQRNLVDLNWALIHLNMSDKDNGYSQGSGTIGNIKCPVTFTCAELDQIVPPAVVRENASAIGGSKLLEYKDSGHSPLVDCPDKLSSDILEHLGR